MHSKVLKTEQEGQELQSIVGDICLAALLVDYRRTDVAPFDRYSSSRRVVLHLACLVCL